MVGHDWRVGIGGVLALGLGCGGAQEGLEHRQSPVRPGARALVITEIEQAAVVNRPPRFLSVAPLTAREGYPYTYDFTALDPEGDEVSYTLVQAPEGASLSGHALKWVPRPAQVGRDQGFTLRAVDEWGAARDQTWKVMPKAGEPPAETPKAAPPTTVQR